MPLTLALAAFCGADVVVACLPGVSPQETGVRPVAKKIFGIEAGEPVRKYRGKVVGDGSDPAYFRIVAPKPTAAFDEYYAFATPETGICKIVAIGKAHQNDVSGAATLSEFNAQKSSLIERFGSGEIVDSIEDYSRLKAPNLWASAIHEGDRRLEIFWGRNQRTQLPATIEAILLSVGSETASSPRIEAAYQFSNWKPCWKARADMIKNHGKQAVSAVDKRQ